jgi:dihydroxyacetone kinase-like predicted kinase
VRDSLLLGACGNPGVIAVTLRDRMLAAADERVTLTSGAVAQADLNELRRRQVAKVRPLVEFRACEGGQALYPLLVGVQ